MESVGVLVRCLGVFLLFLHFPTCYQSLFVCWEDKEMPAFISCFYPKQTIESPRTLRNVDHSHPYKTRESSCHDWNEHDLRTCMACGEQCAPCPPSTLWLNTKSKKIRKLLFRCSCWTENVKNITWKVILNITSMILFVTPSALAPYLPLGPCTGPL